MKILQQAVIIIFIFAIATLSLPALSFAEIPHSINYQGKLTDPSGSPVSDGTHSVTFRIYDVQAGGSPLWYETQYITTEKGLFSTQIGATKDLTLTFDVPYYLGIKVGSDSEMTPRQTLSSSAYAFRAKTAEEALHSYTADSADTVDGIYASALPEPNKILALDAEGKFPAVVCRTEDFAAGDEIIASAPSEYQNPGTSPMKVKEIRIDRGGTIRVTWNMRGNQSRSNTGCVGSRVYRNGVPMGRNHGQCNSNTWQSISEDIDGWSTGDLVQLYSSAQGGYPNRCTVSNFCIRGSDTKSLSVLLDRSN